MSTLRPVRILLISFTLVALAMLPVQGQTIETRAPHAILLDAATGTVLFEKSADEAVHPASLSKLMTIEGVFHAIKEGRLRLEDEFCVSESAWRKGGAPAGGWAMFLSV